MGEGDRIWAKVEGGGRPGTPREVMLQGGVGGEKCSQLLPIVMK